MDGFPGFSGDLFAFLIYNFEVGDVGIVMVVGLTVDVHVTGYLAAMIFHSIF